MDQLLGHALIPESQSALDKKSWKKKKTHKVFSAHLEAGVEVVSERSRVKIVSKSGTLRLDISKIENSCQFRLMIDSVSKKQLSGI